MAINFDIPEISSKDTIGGLIYDYAWGERTNGQRSFIVICATIAAIVGVLYLTSYCIGDDIFNLDHVFKCLKDNEALSISVGLTALTLFTLWCWKSKRESDVTIESSSDSPPNRLVRMEEVLEMIKAYSPPRMPFPYVQTVLWGDTDKISFNPREVTDPVMIGETPLYKGKQIPFIALKVRSKDYNRRVQVAVIYQRGLVNGHQDAVHFVADPYVIGSHRVLKDEIFENSSDTMSLEDLQTLQKLLNGTHPTHELYRPPRLLTT